MRINIARNAALLLFFLLGLVLIWCGYTNRLGVVLGALFVPDYLTQAQTQTGATNG